MRRDILLAQIFMACQVDKLLDIFCGVERCASRTQLKYPRTHSRIQISCVHAGRDYHIKLQAYATKHSNLPTFHPPLCSATHLSTEMQHKCRMLAVEKYTSRLLYTLHMNVPNSQRPDSSTEALNVIAHRATSMSAIASETTK